MSAAAPLASPPLKVINLFGAPGRGKSATRAGVFWLMKAHHLSVEEVSEFAKHLVLTNRRWLLKEEQAYLLAKQLNEQNTVHRNGYDYAVTDSPLQLCSFYAPEGYYRSFEPMVHEATARFENINFFLTRDVAGTDAGYEDRGRDHSLEQAQDVEARMQEYLVQRGIPFTPLPVDMTTPWRILDVVAPGLCATPIFVAGGR